MICVTAVIVRLWCNCWHLLPHAVSPIPGWLPQVAVCLLLQSGIVCTGWALQHWLADSRPCCDRPLVL